MGVGWQDRLRFSDPQKANLMTSEYIAQGIAQFEDDQQRQALLAAFVGIGAIALIALLIAAPELIPFVVADAASETGAAEAPAWAIDAMDNPGNYGRDTIDLAKSFIKSKPLPFHDLPPGELPF